MAITPADLPPEVRAILDQEASEGACLRDQPVCGPDSRVTSQLTDKDPPSNKVLPWRIKNAFKGDLILSPGGPAGLIGGLLKRLDPPQFYSHMGLMIDDFITLRHATSIGDRLEQDQFANGSILGTPAPTDGFDEQALRFQWPGTVTQTVEEAYLTWAFHPAEVGANGEPRKDANGRVIPLKDFSRHDPVTNLRYWIDSLGFSPEPIVVDDRLEDVWPLVVQPCPTLETEAVRDALHRVADAARDLRGHYNLYGYTLATAGRDPSKAGPPQLELDEPDPDDTCTGAIQRLRPTKTTDPMVCSTFIWLAVQRANDKARAEKRPQIVLDGRQQNRPHRADILTERCNQDCGRHRLPNVDKIDAMTPDGLYLYSEAERQSAGTWLHDEYTVPLVRAKVNDKLPFLLRAAGAAVTDYSVTQLLTLFGAFSLQFVATLLGVSALVINELILATTDMPDDVANQLCNAFAADRCATSAKDDDQWRTATGIGHTVSPDNMLNSWAPPTSEDSELIHGLYGYNRRIVMGHPQWVAKPPPPSTWQISQGFGSVEGRVIVLDEQGQKVGVEGARIRIGCTRFTSTSDGGFTRQGLPSGAYWAVASFTSPVSGLHLESAGQRVDVPDGGGIGIELELIPPPDTNRVVSVHGHMDLVNRYAVGKDWWDHPPLKVRQGYVGLDWFPADRPEFAAQRRASMTDVLGDTHGVDDWGSAELKLWIWIVEKDNGSVDVSEKADGSDVRSFPGVVQRSLVVRARARLKNKDDDPWQADDAFTVAPDAEEPHVIDVVRSEMAWPVRGHIEFAVRNDRAP